MPASVLHALLLSVTYGAAFTPASPVCPPCNAANIFTVTVTETQAANYITVTETQAANYVTVTEFQATNYVTVTESQAVNYLTVTETQAGQGNIYNSNIGSEIASSTESTVVYLTSSPETTAPDATVPVVTTEVVITV